MSKKADKLRKQAKRAYEVGYQASLDGDEQLAAHCHRQSVLWQHMAARLDRKREADPRREITEQS